MGGSFGGGQKRPAMFAHTPHNAAILQGLREDPDMQRIARLCDHYFQSYFPNMHNLYNNVLDLLHEDNPEFERNFPECSWAAAHINFLRAVTFRHRDFLNLLFGLCAVFPVGSYDYQCGGHLILWDLGLFLEFPPGTVILLPSALLEHSNVSLPPGQTRSSVTFYSAAGLFRWCHNGFVSDKDMRSHGSPKLLKRWNAYREEMWKEGLGLLKPSA
ncbi:hypothetical protein FB446DRAFT_655424 [Lentinula raphanica]|nr:hypothetical protein C8R42DRAFT_586017 [Lentinula raphanica]KAJ3730385.1 hypothetical protein C8R42DRAFT_568155 [Lentinula raphanica]KAJ3765344.1 hypothetical protein FB446DRAFT_655424 [Lentinula raphanica]